MGTGDWETGRLGDWEQKNLTNTIESTARDDNESMMMKLFLDSLLKFTVTKPDSLTLYTQEMADEMDELLAGVVIDDDENE
jgi:antitoxin PrlF